MLIEEVLPNLHSDENARESYNYITAIQNAELQLRDLPISHRLIKSAHKTLLSGLSAKRGSSKKPGEYKTHQNAIGPEGDSVFNARYVPPPPLETEACMSALEQFINREDRKIGEELIDLALCHYQFEAIHPFGDGNGRIGRMLVTLMAMQFKILDLPLLHVSANLERKRDTYIDLLYKVSTQGEWHNWINFFLAAIQQSCKNATASVDKILKLQAEFKQRVLSAQKSHRLMAIIDSLFDKHWTTTVEIRKLCATSFPTASSDIQALVELKILEPLQKSRPMLYISRPILNLGARD